VECFDDRFVAKLVTGTLPGSDRDLATAHIDSCNACRELVAEAAIATTEQSAPGYRIAGEVARGAMGRILVAKDLRLGREVALKQLIEVTPALRRRFEREVTITAALQHPGIVPVYQAGELGNGEPFYAMRRVRGRGLDIAIAEATTLAQRVALVPRVLAAIDAVAYAHSEHVIHRDLKPQNILVGEFGETVVVDWGLAKKLGDVDDVSEVHVADGAALTRDGAVLGTPAYMAPEQASAGETDARSDIYALGAVLYHVLSGRAPHAGRSITTTLDDVREGRVTPLDQVASGLAPELVAIVERAMASNPADRYPDAGALADDLRGFLAGKLVAAHSYTRWQLVKRWVSRHRAWVVAGTVLVIGLAVIGGISFSRVRAERDTAALQRDTATVERSSAESLVAYAIDEVFQALDASGQYDAINRLSTRIVDYYDHVLAVRPNDKLSRAYRAMALDMQANAAFRTGDLARAEKIWNGVIDVMRDASTVDDSAVLDVGLIYYNLGNIARMRGDTATAEKRYREATAALEPSFAKEPALSGSALAASLDGIAQLRMAVLDTAGARPLAERALEVGQKAAALGGKDDVQAHARVAQLAYSLASLEALEGHRDQARRLFGTGLETLAKLPADDPAFLTSAGYQHFSLALVELADGKLDACAAELAKATKAITEPEKLGYADPQLIRLAGMLDLVEAQRLLAAGKNKDATAAVDRALTVNELLRQKQPEVVQYKRDHAQALATRARAWFATGQTDAAQSSIASALTVLEPLADNPRGKLELAYASIIAAEVGADATQHLARATTLIDSIAVTAKPPLAHARAYVAAVRAHRDPKALDAYRTARAELATAQPLTVPSLAELDRLAGR
jgi:tetratricopeptide (TPR) repeat protein